jgi:hypothetical protein
LSPTVSVENKAIVEAIEKWTAVGVNAKIYAIKGLSPQQ